MTKEEILAFVKEKENAYGNWLCWLRNLNKDPKQVKELKEVFTNLYNLLKEDQTLMHLHDFDHFQYYCKLWYKLPYINKVDKKKA